jgi:hypothetical protein
VPFHVPFDVVRVLPCVGVPVRTGTAVFDGAAVVAVATELTNAESEQRLHCTPGDQAEGRPVRLPCGEVSVQVPELTFRSRKFSWLPVLRTAIQYCFPAVTKGRVLKLIVFQDELCGEDLLPLASSVPGWPLELE